MSDPWDNDPNAGDAWDADPSLDEVDPPASKSEKTARDLGYFDLKAGFGTVAKFGYDMAREAVRGVGGVAGTVAGMVPGGDSPNVKGNKWLEAMSLPEWNPEDPGIQAGMEMTGKGMEKVVQGAKYVGSGYAGLGALAAGASADEATRSMQDFRGTENALGEGTFQATKSPLMATIAQILPEVAAFTQPIKKPPIRRPSPRIAPEMPPSGFGGIGDVEAPRWNPEIPETGPTRQFTSVIDEFREAVRTGDKQKVMEMVNANPALVAAFEQLGIEFTPGMVSENMPMRQTEAALGSMPDSPIPAMHQYVEGQLNARARQLIDQAGGDAMQPGRVGDNIRAEFERVHGELENLTETRWKELDSQIDASGVRYAEIDAKSIADRLETRAQQLGRNGDIDDGLKSMSHAERELWRLTHEKVKVEKKRMHEGEEITETVEEWQYTPPRYEALDAYRRSLLDGHAGKGPFANANVGNLKYLYEQVAGLQQKIAQGNGYGDLYKAANEVVVNRKDLEAAMTRVLGRNQQISPLARIKTATNDLVKGQFENWDQLMKDLPDDVRIQAQAQALESVFFTGRRGEGMSESWLANFEKIKRSPAIRDRLFRGMPQGAMSEFMALGDAATGFFRMFERARSNPSGTAMNNYVLNRLKEPEFMETVIGGFADRATGRLPVIGDWVQTITRRAPGQQAAREASRLQTAANFLNDPVIRRAIVEYASGRVDAANKMIKDSQAWADWVKQQPIPAQERLLSAGLTALFEEESE